MAFTIKQNDTSPALQATLRDANGLAVLLTGATVRLHMVPLNGGTTLDKLMTVVNATGGIIRYNWVAGDTSAVGTYSVEFEVTYSDGSIETFPNNDNLVIVITPELN